MQERKYQSSTAYSWPEIQERLGALAGAIMARKYVAFVTASDLRSNIAANMLANLLQAQYHPNAIGTAPANVTSLVFSLDNHGIQGAQPVIQSNNYNKDDARLPGYACLWRYTYEDQAYNMLMTPEFYLEDITVELDTRPKLIKYPWEL